VSDRRKVLMIDDEPDLCLMVKNNLEGTGEFDVVITSRLVANLDKLVESENFSLVETSLLGNNSSNPEQAEELCQQENPDVLLLDNVMPKRKGSDIVKALKSDSATKHIPIIIVSGKGEMVYSKKKDQFQWLPGNPAARQRGEIIDEKNPQKAAKQYGVEDYVSKPFTTEVLTTVIKEVIEKYGRKKDEETEGGETL